MEKKETQMDVMIQETRQYIMDNLTITSMSNEELEDKIEELIFEKTILFYASIFTFTPFFVYTVAKHDDPATLAFSWNTYDTCLPDIPHNNG